MSSEKFEQTINIDRMEQTVSLFGSFDENIRMLEKEYVVDIINRGGALKICGEPENVSRAAKAVEGLMMLLNTRLNTPLPTMRKTTTHSCRPSPPSRKTRPLKSSIQARIKTKERMSCSILPTQLLRQPLCKSLKRKKNP